MLDLVIQESMDQITNGNWVSVATSLAGHLRKQYNLRSDMETTCPQICRTRWHHWARFCDWQYLNITRVRSYLEDNESSQDYRPSITWWIIVCVLKVLLEDIDYVFGALQGKTILIMEQKELFKRIVNNFTAKFNIELNLAEEVVNVTDRSKYVVYKDCRLDLSKVRDFMESGELGIFVRESLSTLLELTKKNLIVEIGNFILIIANGLEHTLVLRDSNNNGVEEDQIHYVLPQNVARMEMNVILEFIEKNKERLNHNFSDLDLQTLVVEVRSLKKLWLSPRNNDEIQLVNLLKQYTYSTTFAESWHQFSKKFPISYKFFGGIGTAFPGTATVESDFSIIGCEKDENNYSLSHYSLEACIVNS